VAKIVILHVFQDLFQSHIGLMDSGSAAGMTERVAKKGRRKRHPEPACRQAGSE
jgi:hypothetical protein